MQFTIGSDPEYILTDGKRAVSAIGIIEGTKSMPKDTSFGKVHVDNIAAEINIFPAQSMMEFDQNMVNGLDGLTAILTPHGLQISRLSVAEFSEEELSHPTANEAGCDPDVNAYTQTWNCVPMLQGIRHRCVGGHIHIGADLTPSDMEKLAKTLDLMVSLPSMAHDHPIRRGIYGGAGSFRPKPYGMEYRTPSNNWTFDSATRQWVFMQVDRALHEFKTISLPEDLDMIINGHHLSFIAPLCEKYEIPHYPTVL